MGGHPPGVGFRLDFRHRTFTTKAFDDSAPSDLLRDVRQLSPPSRADGLEFAENMALFATVCDDGLSLLHGTLDAQPAGSAPAISSKLESRLKK